MKTISKDLGRNLPGYPPDEVKTDIRADGFTNFVHCRRRRLFVCKAPEYPFQAHSKLETQSETATPDKSFRQTENNFDKSIIISTNSFTFTRYSVEIFLPTILLCGVSTRFSPMKRWHVSQQTCKCAPCCIVRQTGMGIKKGWNERGKRERGQL